MEEMFCKRASRYSLSSEVGVRVCFRTAASIAPLLRSRPQGLGCCVAHTPTAPTERSLFWTAHRGDNPTLLPFLLVQKASPSWKRTMQHVALVNYVHAYVSSDFALAVPPPVAVTPPLAAPSLTQPSLSRVTYMCMEGFRVWIQG